jgi:hypothetical protein
VRTRLRQGARNLRWGALTLQWGKAARPLIRFLRAAGKPLNNRVFRGCLASEGAIDAQHSGDPVVHRVITGIP